MGRPHVEADEVVHLLEGLQHDRGRHVLLHVADEPGRDLRAAEVPRAAHDVDLGCLLLHQRADVLDGEGPVAVDDARLALALRVVGPVEGAVLDVAAEVVFAVELHLVELVEEARPDVHRAGDEEAAVVLAVVGRHVLHGVVPLLRRGLLDRRVEHRVLVQAVLLCALAHHHEDLMLRGPRAVRHVSEELWHRSVVLSIVVVVGAPLRLKLRVPVRDPHPREAAEVL
mmetsp:Transcript_79864/g.209720  ORF Transcript_79864/g.209720 Transcript_79864/m.209720 type:complete len:227 (+) Transcript_79864:882-1562(+)